MIALFDSGYGGLTVLKPILELLPEYDYLYLGDNARSPYGGHSADNICKFSEQAVEYLFQRKAKLILFACNTASSAALSHVQQKYLKGSKEKSRKILGVLIPLAEEAVKTTRNGHIGVIGTRATIESRVYKKEIGELMKGARVFTHACPLLVPLIEEGWHKKPEARSILKKYLKPLKSTNIDTLIPGCTHYQLMEREIKRIMGKKINILPSGKIVAQSLQDYLNRHPEIEKKLGKNRKRTFMTTDDPQRFKDFVEQYIKIKITGPEKVELG